MLRSSPREIKTKNNYKEFEGVRITPAILLFKDTFETDTIKLNFKVQNISNKPKTVRIMEGKTVGFKFSTTPHGMLLAPGQSITRTVKYVSLRKVWSSIRESSIPIFVENKCFAYPVIIEEGNCIIVVEPTEIDFGVINMGTSPVTFLLTIKNKGQLPTKFAFDLGNNPLDLSVQPMKGDLNANSSVQIRIQVVAVFTGRVFTEFWLCGSWPAIRIPVTMDVNIPRLEILGPNKTWYFTLIDFEHTYFGTNRCSTVVLKNMSTHMSYFLVLGEVNNKMIVLNEAAETVPAFNAFCIRPQEGSLSPFEQRLCSFEFKPRVKYTKKSIWKTCSGCKEEFEFLIFMMAIRVQSLTPVQLEKAIQNHLRCSKEPIMSSQLQGNIIEPYEMGNDQELEGEILESTDEESNYLPKEASIESISSGNFLQTAGKLDIPLVRICLHGIAMHTNVKLTPTEIHLGDLERGIPQHRVLAIKNHNNYLPVCFKYEKIQAIDILPPEGKIEPLKSIEVAVTITSSAIGAVKKKVVIKILGRTEPFAEEPKLVVLNQLKLLVTYNTPSRTIIPEPKFNMGITPQITNEVGLFTDDVTFDSPVKKPPVPMLGTDISTKRGRFQSRTKNKEILDITTSASHSPLPEKKSNEQDKYGKHSNLKERRQASDQISQATLHADTERFSGGTIHRLEKIPESDIVILQDIAEDQQSSRRTSVFLPPIGSCTPTTKSLSSDGSASRSEKLKSLQNFPISGSSSGSMKSIISERIGTVISPLLSSISNTQSSSKTTDSSDLTLQTNTSGESNERQIIKEKATSYFQRSFHDTFGALGIRKSSTRSGDHLGMKKDNLKGSQQTIKSDQKDVEAKVLVNVDSSKSTTVISDEEEKGSCSLSQANIIDLSSSSVTLLTNYKEDERFSNSSEFRKKLSFSLGSHSGHGSGSSDPKSQQIKYPLRKSIKSPSDTSKKNDSTSQNKLISSKSPSDVLKENKPLSQIKDLTSKQNIKTGNMAKLSSDQKSTNDNIPQPVLPILKQNSTPDSLTKRGKIKVISGIKKPVRNSSRDTTNTDSTTSRSKPLDKRKENGKSILDNMKKHREVGLHTDKKLTGENDEYAEGKLKLETEQGDDSCQMPFQKKQTMPRQYGIRSVMTIQRKPSTCLSDYATKDSSAASMKIVSNKSSVKSFILLKKYYSTGCIDEALEAARHMLQGSLEVSKPDHSEQVGIRDNLQKQIVAFPNDMGRTLRRCPSVNKPRTIFTRSPRYSCPIDSSNTFTPKELAARKANNDKYIKYMRETGARLKKTITKDTEESTMCVNKFERLWKSSKYTPQMTQQIIERKCFTNKESLHPLTPQQLYKIRVKPRAINFGRVAPMSHITDSFVVENLNSFPITFAFVPAENGISFPSGSRKIVKANSKLCFKMIFYVESLGRHNGSMEYIINENHSFDVSVYAEVVPKSLTLAQTTLEFKNLPCEIKNRPSFLTVGIVNNLQCYTKFYWDVPPRSSFNICPMKGQVPPTSTLQLCVTFKGDTIKPLSADLIMKSEIGEKMKLRCISYLKDPKNVGFFDKKLDLRELPLNLFTEHTIFAYNGCHCSYMFKVVNPELMPGITVLPVSGTLKPRSIFPFAIQCQIKAIIKFEVTLQVQLERSKIIELTIVGSVGYPVVLLKPSELKLRRMSVDSTDTIRLRLLNKGTTTAKVKFLLQGSQFNISTSQDIYAPKENDKDEYILEASKSKSLFLHFTPHDVATYISTLPIIINDILGPVELERPETWLTEYYITHDAKWFNSRIVPQNFPRELSFIHVKCTVANHILSISKPRVNLTYYTAEEKTFDVVCLKNKLDHDILVKIDMRNLCLKDCNFILSFDNENVKCSELNFKLQASESQNFQIMFFPKVPGKYSLKLPIYIEEYEGLYNNIYVEGLYPHPSIEANITEVYFPPIPLGVESVRKITLIASYYRTTESIYTSFTSDNFNINALPDKMQVIFQQGNRINPSESSMIIPVILTFKSSAPVSFTTIIRFYDNRGAECYINVSASADNCTLSTYTFLKAINSSYELESTSEYSLGDQCSVANEENSLLKKTDIFPSKSEGEMIEGLLTKSRSCRINMARKYSVRSAPVPIHYSTVAMAPEASSIFSTLSFNTVNGNEEEEEMLNESRNETQYPMFPLEDDDSDMSKYLHNILESTEWWLYNIGFHGAYAPSIPNGMSVLVSDDLLEVQSKLQKNFATKTVLDLLNELKGGQILKRFNKSQVPDTPVERVLYIYKLYKYLIEFLMKHKACLAHVKPSHLLCYKDYVMYMTRVPYNPQALNRMVVVCDLCDNLFSSLRKFCHSHSSCHTLLNSKEFTLHAQQAWMDLILQIHKTLVLSKLSPEPSRPRKLQSKFDLPQYIDRAAFARKIMVLKIVQLSPVPAFFCSVSYDIVPTQCSKPTLRESETISIEAAKGSELLKDSMYGTAECILLNWLDSNFKIQQSVLWTATEFKILPKDREISNFCKDLSDGLVFAAITATYCPYLNNMLSDIYPHPQGEEESIHNAIKVIKAWETIKLGITVKPQDIVYPNPVKMVLLTSYLYEMLPSCNPRSTIHFKAELSREEEQIINLNNPTDKNITFGVLILGDPLGMFRLKSSETSVTLKRCSSTDISIIFTAKVIQPAKAIIIFHAHTAPICHLHNVTFELAAECTILTVHEMYNVSLPLYSANETHIKIDSPYDEEAEYDIYVTEEEPTTSDKLKAYLWRDIAIRRLPRRFLINQDKIFKCATEKTMDFHFLYNCALPEIKNYWIIFRNATVGDFIIKLIFSPLTNTIIKKIRVDVPSDWKISKCKCEDLHPDCFEMTEGCYLRTEVALPRKNKMLWKSFKQILDQVSSSDEEKQFWAKYLETNIGLQLGCCLIVNDEITANNNNHRRPFGRTYTYNITTNKKKMILTPKQIHIPDILAPDTISLPIHVFSDLESDLKVRITLESEGQLEIRNYEVVFHKEISPECIVENKTKNPATIGTKYARKLTNANSLKKK